jgi:hypothetical protein
MYREMLLAWDGDEVRAGLLLHHGTLWLRGEERPFCWLGLPVSEGLIDRRHTMAIVHLVSSVLAREPLLMDLGIGSLDETIAQFLMQLGWRYATVPFMFHPVRARRVLLGLSYLRSKPRLNLALRLAAYSGSSAILDGGLALLRRAQRARLRGYDLCREPSFGAWADHIYAQARTDYGAAVVRDAASLNICYPPGDQRYLRLRVRSAQGHDLGWVVVIHAQMREQKYFGNLHVGTLVDGFGAVPAVPVLVHAGLQWLVDAGVDLVVANLSHKRWREAARMCGFLPGPSNYFFFVSPEGNTLLQPGCSISEIHLTRGDGDGPFSLMPEPTTALS